MTHGTLTGTGLLVRAALRRDRIMLVVWIVLLVGTVYASAAATPGLYPDPAVRIATARGWNDTPAVVALYGPITDPGSLGELSMTKMTVLYAVLVGVMALVVVRRHLRAEEESGRTELVAATRVGRHAALAAALVTVAAASLALGAGAATVNAVAGLPVRGSILFGAAWAGTGLVFGAATALACQFSSSTRTCAMIAAAGLGGAFAVRMAGDTTRTWVSWLSPLGWNTRLLGWSDAPRWWVLGLYLALSVLLTAVAVVLSSRRDLGSGLLAARPGPLRGARSLAGPLALTWRGTRGAFAAWAAAALALGALFGAITPTITDLLSTPGAREMIVNLGGAGALEDSMVAAETGIIAVMVTCFAVMVAAHAGADEHAGRTELALASGAGRGRTAGAVALVALLGATVLLVLVGVALAVGYAVSGASGDAWRLVPAGVVHAPAVWVVTALTLLVQALRSRWTWAGWVLVVAFLTLGEFGELLKLPGWVQDLSPYAHTPRWPAEAVGWLPLVLLALTAAVTTGVAWVVYRRRDIG